MDILNIFKLNVQFEEATLVFWPISTIHNFTDVILLFLNSMALLIKIGQKVLFKVVRFFNVNDQCCPVLLFYMIIVFYDYK